MQIIALPKNGKALLMGGGRGVRIQSLYFQRFKWKLHPLSVLSPALPPFS